MSIPLVNAAKKSPIAIIVIGLVLYGIVASFKPKAGGDCGCAP